MDAPESPIFSSLLRMPLVTIEFCRSRKQRACPLNSQSPRQVRDLRAVGVEFVFFPVIFTEWLGMLRTGLSARV
jgi:hypothetical protein